MRLGELLDELRWLGAPDDCNIRDFVKEKWFKSIARYSELSLCIRIDTDALYVILLNAKLVPRKCGKRTRKDGTTNFKNITSNEFRTNKILSWNLFFDVEKILKLVHNKKEFDSQICSDGVSVSLMYKKPKVPPVETTDDEIKAMYDSNELKYAVGCDPGEFAKQGRRNAKAERITRLFTFEEQADRNRIAAMIGEMPSPKGPSWLSYIEHRLRVMNDGIETYSTKQYARLGLDKHIESVRAIDKTACKMVHNQPSIFYMGASGSTPANSPIKIKKHVRCPGTRKLLAANMKRGNCIIRMVNEYMTSQHCPLYFKRFPQQTRRDRYKACVGCVPNPVVDLPTLIVTNVSKRLLQM